MAFNHDAWRFRTRNLDGLILPVAERLCQAGYIKLGVLLYRLERFRFSLFS
jgi:hypothetical protein